MTESGGNPRGGGRVGVRDVARLAGVSTQTVSRVLNNSANLREETRQRVLEAMVQLDYRPNNAARALGTATTRTLGVVATDVTLYGPTVAIAALAAATRDEGRWVASAYADATDAASVDAAVSHVLGQGVDGIVLVAPHARTRDALVARSMDVPIVIMHGGQPDRQAEGSSPRWSTWSPSDIGGSGGWAVPRTGWRRYRATPASTRRCPPTVSRPCRTGRATGPQSREPPWPVRSSPRSSRHMDPRALSSPTTRWHWA